MYLSTALAPRGPPIGVSAGPSANVWPCPPPYRWGAGLPPPLSTTASALAAGSRRAHLVQRRDARA
eukprot:2994006-Alexandrium_andersonii.AAC.1